MLVTATVAAAAGGRITVQPEATVAGQTIRLGDIATLEGGTRELAGLSLGAAPAAGESRSLDGGTVLATLRRETDGLPGVTYTIPTVVRVRRATQEISEGAVRAIVEAFLAESLGAARGGAMLHAIDLTGPVRIPAGPYRARVIPPTGVPLLGRTRLEIEFVVDDHPVLRTWVTADIGLNGVVVLAKRPVARGETLGADDVVADERDLSRVARGIVTNVADAVGMVAQAPLVPYTPLRREQLAPPATVRRGDVVLLVAERHGLRITTAGEVREDAGTGQQVRVVNRTSRKELVGHVVDRNTVAVEF